MAFSGPKNTGAFVPTTNVWDVDELYSVDVQSPEFKELLVRLYQNINNIALSLNIKDTGYYVNDNEFVNGQVYFPNPNLNSSTSTAAQLRQVYRKVINFGALPNTATKSVAHGLTPNNAWSFTRIYGCATNPVALNYIPLPYVSAVLKIDDVELYVDAANVNIRTSSNYSAYTVTYIVIEYIKF